jgi:hypothetical protein
MAFPLDRSQNRTEEVLDEGHAFCTPRRLEQSKSTGIDKDTNIPIDRHVDKVKGGLGSTERIVL